MTRIRWRKRLHGWAGFVGTSRKATCWVRELEPRRWHARAAGRFLRSLPSWREAAAWCEEQLRPIRPTAVPRPALVVEADGKAELRPLEHLYPGLHVSPPSLRIVDWGPGAAPSSMLCEVVTYQGRWWAMSYDEYRYGISGEFRIMVYSHPDATPEVIERAAMREFKRRRMMLDELVYERVVSYEALRRAAETIFSGELL